MTQAPRQHHPPPPPRHDGGDAAAPRDPLEDAARRSQTRAQAGRDAPEPSLARRFGQIGVLGWIIVAPTLLLLWGGHRLDLLAGGGIMFGAAGLMLGAGLGLWLAIRWMHDQ